MKPEVLAPLAREAFESETAQILLIHYVGLEVGWDSNTYQYREFQTPELEFQTLYENGEVVSCPFCNAQITVSALYYDFVIASYADSEPDLARLLRRAYSLRLAFFGAFLFFPLLAVTLAYFFWPESGSFWPTIGTIVAAALTLAFFPIPIALKIRALTDNSNYLVQVNSDTALAYPGRAVRVPQEIHIVESESEHKHFVAQQHDAVGSYEIEANSQYILGWRMLACYFLNSSKVSALFKSGNLKFLDRGKIPNG